MLLCKAPFDPPSPPHPMPSFSTTPPPSLNLLTPPHPPPSALAPLLGCHAAFSNPLPPPSDPPARSKNVTDLRPRNLDVEQCPLLSKSPLQTPSFPPPPLPPHPPPHFLQAAESDHNMQERHRPQAQKIGCRAVHAAMQFGRAGIKGA